MKTFIKEITWRLGTLNEHGWGNGYVCIPPGHPMYEVAYDDIPVDVHGGLSFACPAKDLDWPEIPEDCKDCWIVGFATAHYGDTVENCDKWYVESQAEKLAEQLLTLFV